MSTSVVSPDDHIVPSESSERSRITMLVSALHSDWKYPYPPPLFLFNSVENIQEQLLVSTAKGRQYSNNRLRGILFEPLFKNSSAGVDTVVKHMINVRRGKKERRITDAQFKSLIQADGAYHGMLAVETRNKQLSREKGNRRIQKMLDQQWLRWQRFNLVLRDGTESEHDWFMLGHAPEIEREDDWKPAIDPKQLHLVNRFFGSEENALLRLGGEITEERWLEWQRHFLTEYATVV